MLYEVRRLTHSERLGSVAQLSCGHLVTADGTMQVGQMVDCQLPHLPEPPPELPPSLRPRSDTPDPSTSPSADADPPPEPPPGDRVLDAVETMATEPRATFVVDVRVEKVWQVLHARDSLELELVLNRVPQSHDVYRLFDRGTSFVVVLRMRSR